MHFRTADKVSHDSEPVDYGLHRFGRLREFERELAPGTKMLAPVPVIDIAERQQRKECTLQNLRRIGGHSTEE
jgi:hypothetical protein